MKRTSGTVAAPFVKVRADHAAETAQDYVEAISDIVHRTGACRVIDLARHLGVSHVTVSRIITRLQEQELVETEPYRPIRLTAKGERLAAMTRQRHETVVAFLLAVGVPEADAHRDAEGIEHHVGDATLQAMKSLLEQARQGRIRVVSN
ncbi:MAG: manganese-binding transcriptional regulator MntR [Phycisphaerales bacterium]|nr:manganese-binding transcriptional regulator MntR [Phycisphaerales bacterium]MCI0631928.1 manganese-binding transcriptional regulator MntR [Phycisphaerales bacterium]MCI0676200.1 manganese-binding transcriptional regulator MntR [Phycisphaerales bacterium]